MDCLEGVTLNSKKDIEKFYADLRSEVDSFDIREFYESNCAKALMVITPKQLIIVPVHVHDMALSYLYYNVLYGVNVDCNRINNIVVRLDSYDLRLGSYYSKLDFYNLKLFIPTFPKSINHFQNEVFSHYFEQLEQFSNILFSNPQSYYFENFEEIKDRFAEIHIDDSFVPIKETIISVSAEEWHNKQKIA